MKREEGQGPAWIPQGLLDAARGRTAEVITRARRAMEDMAREVQEHDGIYPYNNGRVNQSEVCRRAGISKITLQGQVHKKTTKKEIDEWVALVGKTVSAGKKCVRKVVTERADSWKAAHAAIANQYHLAELELVEARQRIKALENENEALRSQLKTGSKVVAHKPRPRGDMTRR